MNLAIAAIILAVALSYKNRLRVIPKLNGLYSSQFGAWYFIKVVVLSAFLLVVKIIRRVRRRKNVDDEVRQNSIPASLTDFNQTNYLTFIASDTSGNVLLARIFRKGSSTSVAQVNLLLRLSDGRVFTNTVGPDCVVLDETPLGDESDDNFISAGGLRIRTIEHVQTYRLLYSGLMAENGQQGEPSFKEVNLRFLFKGLTDPANFTIDFAPCHVAKSIAAEPSCHHVLNEFLNSSTIHLEQSGEVRGFVEVEGRTIEMSLNGVRDYLTTVGNNPPLLRRQGAFELHARLENGLVISLSAISCANFLTHKTEGFVTFPTGYVYPVTWTDLHLAALTHGCNVPEAFDLNFTAHGRVFSLAVEVLSTRTVHLYFQNSSNDADVIHQNVVKVTLGSDIGFGIIEFNKTGESVKIAKEPKISIVKSVEAAPIMPFVVPFCINLNDPICRLGAATGGKAAKLADIVAVLSKPNEGGEYLSDLAVPEGFAVSVSAFEDHLKWNPKINELKDRVLAAAGKQNKASAGSSDQETLIKDLEKACDDLHKAFMAAPLSPSLRKDIEHHLVNAFGLAWEETLTAVRSSAVGEDGVEASGAGQMETFLGIKGIEKVLEAVKKCWASNYHFRALQYRRQMCAKLDSPMSVLIQRLVKADVAGVLFTQHPDTGSTSQMVINASFGIGESVVSGAVTPDTVTVHRLDPRDESAIRIEYTVVGEKATTFGIDENDDFVKVEATASHNSVMECCLTEKEIRRLNEIGRFIQNIFRSGRDIEFAVKRDVATGRTMVMILQARPITTADTEQEWELLHEFDSPLAGSREGITTQNIQEMMPGALTPLAAKVWLAMIGNPIERSLADVFFRPRRRFQLLRITGQFHQHLFINYTMLGCMLTNEMRKFNMDMAMFCRRVDELSIEHFVEQSDMTSKGWQMLLSFLEVVGVLIPQHRLPSMIKDIETFKTPSAPTAKFLFQQIQDMMPFVCEVWLEHVRINYSASIYPTLIMRTLDSSMTWNRQVQADLATMLSTCDDVYSADVPTRLQEIARLLSQDKEMRSKFLEMDRKSAAKWLLSIEESGPIGDSFQQFLAKHGHRCVRDSDIREKSWNEEPEKVVDALKVMVASNTDAASLSYSKKELTVEEAIDSIKTPTTSIQKMLLRWFVPKSRKYVGMREWAKSYGIKMADHLRRAYSRLAEMLTDSGYLPDADLIYFLDVQEIKTLLDRRSPKLVAKALRRRRFFSRFNGLIFDELEFGHPKPVTQNSATTDEHLNREPLILKGTAVGLGCVTGTARVVKSLAEANQIKPGEILIVQYTDVGWTPYFPTISGLVTELGGLISHGAVVAREYGLPCLVGCRHATTLIKTGDEVSIDGRTGEIKVKPGVIRD